MRFELYGITEELLNELSYESKLGKSLKNTLRKFDNDDLVNEILDIKEFYESTYLLKNVKLYYQKSNRHYPIEIQVNSKSDRKINDWLHIHLYKHIKDNSIGALLREKYDNNEIRSEDELKEVLKDVLFSSKKV